MKHQRLTRGVLPAEQSAGSDKQPVSVFVPPSLSNRWDQDLLLKSRSENFHHATGEAASPQNSTTAKRCTLGLKTWIRRPQTVVPLVPLTSRRRLSPSFCGDVSVQHQTVVLYGECSAPLLVLFTFLGGVCMRDVGFSGQDVSQMSLRHHIWTHQSCYGRYSRPSYLCAPRVNRC